MKFRLGTKTSDDLDITLTSTPKPLQAGLDSRSAQVPDQIGAYDFGSDLRPLIFRLNCEFEATSESDLQDKIRNLADYLFDDEGNAREMELSFTDEPDKYWTVRYHGRNRAAFVDRLVGNTIGRFTLQLIAHDPRAHESEDTTTETITSSGGSFVVTNSGTLKTPIKIKITNNGSSTINGFKIKREVT